MDDDTIGKALALLKHDNVRVQRALARLKARGLSAEDADAEIARAFLGCLSEQDRGLPNRFAQVIDQVAAGRTTAEIFRTKRRQVSRPAASRTAPKRRGP